jgi:hypothetical protein
MSGTARLSMPLLSPGQAQKELFHNEALQMLDMLVAAAVEDAPRASPPASPVLGECHVVAANPTGDWAGMDQCLAAFTSGGWRFIPPGEGMIAYIRSSGIWAVYRSGAWELGALRGSSVVIDGLQVVGGRAAAIPAPQGGATVDAEARTAIGEVLNALRQHGLVEM